MDGNTPTSKYGGVAQLGEHLLCKQGVIGSNPFISTSPAEESKWLKQETQEGAWETTSQTKKWAYSSAG